MKDRTLIYVERCNHCPFFDYPITKGFRHDGVCTRSNFRAVVDQTSRPDWCPLDETTVMVIGGRPSSAEI